MRIFLIGSAAHKIRIAFGAFIGANDEFFGNSQEVTVLPKQISSLETAVRMKALPRFKATDSLHTRRTRMLNIVLVLSLTDPVLHKINKAKAILLSI